MDCVAILDSSNYVFKLCSVLERKGYVFEIISTPCQIAKGGCGYCIKFPEQHRNMIINEGMMNSTLVREIYRIVPLFTRNKYEQMY